MAAAQRGDASAYHRLLSEVAIWLRRYYARRLPPAMIDDTIQDTLIAVHEKRHTYDPSRPFGAWLAAIARYKWIDALRSLEGEANGGPRAMTFLSLTTKRRSRAPGPWNSC